MFSNMFMSSSFYSPQMQDPVAGLTSSKERLLPEAVILKAHGSLSLDPGKSSSGSQSIRSLVLEEDAVW